MIIMLRVNGFRKRMLVPNEPQTLWLPTLHGIMLLMPILAALLACGLVSPVLATPLANATGASYGPVEDTSLTLADCCAHTATLLQDIAVLQRSLSQCADSSAASEARADALAGKLLEWERTASRLQLENAALRSRLEAPPSPEEKPDPTVASSQPRSSSSHTAQLSADAGRNAYPATLPVFGAQPSGHWRRVLCSVGMQRTAGAILIGWLVRVPGFYLQVRRCVELHRVPSKPTVPRSARAHA
jgi:hypothetical protein